MTKKKVKTIPYDSADFLTSPGAVHTYLQEALATGDPVFVAHALGAVARARGMTRIAKKAGLSRESLYKALSTNGNPEFGTILRVMHALGLKLSLQPTAGQ